MKINRNDIENFGGIFVSFHYSPVIIENNAFLTGVDFIDLGNTKSVSQRILVIAFESEIDMSNFVSIASNVFTVSDVNDNLIYKCTLINTPTVQSLGNNKYICECNVYSCCTKDLVIINNQKGFIVDGNIETNYIIEVSSTGDKENITINGYTIKLLKANNPFIIDGIAKRVYYASTPSISEFDNVEGLFTFPKFSPGNQVVDINDDSVIFTISYYPTFM